MIDRYVRARAKKIEPPAKYKQQPHRIVAISSVLSDKVEDGLDGGIITHVNGVEVYNLQHYVDLVLEAVKNAGPLPPKIHDSDSPSSQGKDVGTICVWGALNLYILRFDGCAAFVLFDSGPQGALPVRREKKPHPFMF